MSDPSTPLTLGFTVTSTPNTPEQIAAATAYVKARAGDGAGDVLEALGMGGAA